MVNVKEKKATIRSTFEEKMSIIDICPVSDIAKEIAKCLDISVNSVMGSTFGSDDKYPSQPWFTQKYIKRMVNTINGKQSCIINRDLFGVILTDDSGNKLGTSYDSEEKKIAREFIYKDVLSLKSPYILTMGGETGLDIKYALEKNDNCDIINVERNKNTFALYEQLGYNSFNYNMSFNDFISSNINSVPFDLINYDSTGYISKTMDETLKTINEYKRCKYLVLTVQHIKNGFRNTGEHAKQLRIKYKDSDNSQFECITDIMTNYKLIEEHKYKQKGKRKYMVIYKFKLKK